MTGRKAEPEKDTNMAAAAASARAQAETARPPSRIWTFAEGRAVFELGAFLMARPLLSYLPKGDGHAVQVLPGFLATDTSTVPLRRLLKKLGYDAHGWNSGRNIRVDNALIARLEGELKRLNDQSGRKVSLVGWSLGGVLARELAKLHPDRVRLVMSLGSPISDDRNHTSAARLFERLNGKEPEAMRGGRFRGLGEAPPVPTTSILSKTDGIVHWRGSVQKPSATPTENIEVYASHLGLGVNPSVMVAIADRLAQPDGVWAPFAPPLTLRMLFPSTPLS